MQWQVLCQHNDLCVSDSPYRHISRGVSICPLRTRWARSKGGVGEVPCRKWSQSRASVADGSSWTFLNDELLYRILLRFLRVG